MEQSIENFTGTKNVNVGYTEGDVQAGIEFIYHMREHLVDVSIATVYLITVYATLLYLKKKLS
tara:strand:+ start:727 stop:915 length:189 start_codon:yes stop_codon:yes gene_type:complete